MSALVDTIGAYGWWIVGLVLLVLEIAAPGVYLLFLGIAAIVVGANALVFQGSDWFGWGEQIVAFIVVSGLAVLAGRKWYGSRSEQPGSSTLNRPAERFAGRVAILSQAIVDGRGRIALEDGWWMVEGPDLPLAARVRIVGARGSVLLVEAAGERTDP